MAPQLSIQSTRGPQVLYTNSTRKSHTHKKIRHQAEILSRFHYLERKMQTCTPHHLCFIHCSRLPGELVSHPNSNPGPHNWKSFAGRYCLTIWHQSWCLLIIKHSENSSDSITESSCFGVADPTQQRRSWQRKYQKIALMVTLRLFYNTYYFK